MACVIETLSVELCDLIVSHLGFYDIARLRLTSRTVAFKVSGGHFASYFKTKTIPLRTTALQDFVKLTDKGGLGCRLQHCTISGTILDDRAYVLHDMKTLNRPLPKKLDSYKQNSTHQRDSSWGIIHPFVAKPRDSVEESLHTELLTQAFLNLRRFSADGALSSLHVSLVVPRLAVRLVNTTGTRYNVGDMTAIWDEALITFNIVCGALAASKLLISDRLNLFGDIVGCSLVRTAYQSFFDSQAATGVFHTLKHLTLNLSAPHRASGSRGPGGLCSWNSGDIAALAREPMGRPSHVVLHDTVLQLCCVAPQLESLDLHWYRLQDERLLPQNPQQPFMDAEDEQESRDFASISMRLETCNLRGLYLTESHLIAFLEAVRPTHLTLEDTTLVAGRYHSTFAFITSPDSPVTSYHLEDLNEGLRLVHYNVPGTSAYPYREPMGPSTLTRLQTRGTKEAIPYVLPTSAPVHQATARRFSRARQEKNGPPQNRSVFLYKVPEAVPLKSL